MNFPKRTAVAYGWGAIVTVYRVYSVDREGRLGGPEEIKAEEDNAAIELAHELMRHVRKGELWEGRRLVATLDDQGWTPNLA